MESSHGDTASVQRIVRESSHGKTASVQRIVKKYSHGDTASVQPIVSLVVTSEAACAYSNERVFNDRVKMNR
jgi:apolipoprotein N-acyltransferase